jgi:hypothetical protein
MMRINSISDYINKSDKKVRTYFSSGKFLRRVTSDLLPRKRDLLKRLGSLKTSNMLDANT